MTKPNYFPVAYYSRTLCINASNTELYLERSGAVLESTQPLPTEWKVNQRQMSKIFKKPKNYIKIVLEHTCQTCLP